MLVTGLALYLPSIAGQIGSRQAIKEVHPFAAAGWIVALLVVAAVGNRRVLRSTAREFDRFDADDRSWLRGGRAPQGRFNAGQEIHAIAQAAAATLFVISGSLLWLGERNTTLRLDGSIVLHDVATIATGLLVAGHLYLALIHPCTRPALRGIVDGTVDKEWARSHHAKWRPSSGEPTKPASSNAMLTGSLLALAFALALASVILIPSS